MQHRTESIAAFGKRLTTHFGCERWSDVFCKRLSNVYCQKCLPDDYLYHLLNIIMSNDFK